MSAGQTEGYGARTGKSAGFTVMHRTFKDSAKVRFSFSGGPHAPVNMVDSMEEGNISGKKKCGNGILAELYIFCMPSKSLRFFGTSIASLVPETGELPAFCILSAMSLPNHSRTNV